MPRRKAIDTDAENGERAPVQAATKPEGISDREWAIGGVLGNLALATALLDVVGGKRAPRDEHETATLMDAARKLEARSYRRYRTLASGIIRKVQDAKKENMGYAEMVEILRVIEEDPEAFVGQNGSGDHATDALIAQNTEPRGMGEICNQGIDETDQGSRVASGNVDGY